MTERPPTPPGYMLLTNAEYRRLIVSAQCDDTLVWCETCGAWLDHQDPAVAPIDSDYRGCWKMATGRMKDSHLCRSWRAPDREPTVGDCKQGADLALPDASTTEAAHGPAERRSP